jgi:hypothetical protein
LTSVWRIGYCPSPPPAESALLASLGWGSTLGNGRWHTRGPLQVVYTGASRALCQLEKRVHCNGAHPKGQALMRLDLPDDAHLLDVTDLGLPADWRGNEAATQAIGMSWTAAVSSLGRLGAILCRARRKQPDPQPGASPVPHDQAERRAPPLPVRSSAVLRTASRRSAAHSGPWHGAPLRRARSGASHPKYFCATVNYPQV